MLKCDTCPRGCTLEEGSTGSCRARACVNGRNIPMNYGAVTSLALDPIEKKPLARFMSGSVIMSLGSFGCNLHCQFCQNHEISQTGLMDAHSLPGIPVRRMTPVDVCQMAQELREKNGNIGVAYTYNEPLIAWEFVRDSSRLIREAGMVNVIVTNGCVTERVLNEVLPYTDAMNIDMKVFNVEGYRKLGGNLKTVMASIEKAAPVCHVEVTTLIVPGLNDSPIEMEAEAKWLSSIDPEIPLHITRYFPRYMMSEGEPTERGVLYRLAGVAGEYLRNVFTGNI